MLPSAQGCPPPASLSPLAWAVRTIRPPAAVADAVLLSVDARVNFKTRWTYPSSTAISTAVEMFVTLETNVGGEEKKKEAVEEMATEKQQMKEQQVPSEQRDEDTLSRLSSRRTSSATRSCVS